MWDCSKIMTLAETKKTHICLNFSNPGLTFEKNRVENTKLDGPDCTFKVLLCFN